VPSSEGAPLRPRSRLPLRGHDAPVERREVERREVERREVERREVERREVERREVEGLVAGGA